VYVVFAFTVTDALPAESGDALPTPLLIEPDERFSEVQLSVTSEPGATDDADAVSVQAGTVVCVVGGTITGGTITAGVVTGTVVTVVVLSVQHGCVVRFVAPAVESCVAAVTVTEDTCVTPLASVVAGALPPSSWVPAVTVTEDTVVAPVDAGAVVGVEPPVVLWFEPFTVTASTVFPPVAVVTAVVTADTTELTVVVTAVTALEREEAAVVPAVTVTGLTITCASAARGLVYPNTDAASAPARNTASTTNTPSRIG
jgi:hypothetical protein